MKHWLVKIKTLSDTMPGSGESVLGVIDSDIRYDDCGMPYMTAKTLKGLLREQMEMLQKFNPSYNSENIRLSDLLGGRDIDAGQNGRLKFSDVTVSEGIRRTVEEAIRNEDVSKTEILNALTVTYTYTKIDPVTGTAADHSLRRERMVKKGMLFESVLALDDDGLSEEKEELYISFINDAVRALQHIGTHKSKGKGAVRCTLEEVRTYE